MPCPHEHNSRPDPFAVPCPRRGNFPAARRCHPEEPGPAGRRRIRIPADPSGPVPTQVPRDDTSPAGAHGPLLRHLPRHALRPHVRDRADAHLLGHDLVPLRLRRDLGGAARLGARRLRPPPPAWADGLLAGAGRPLHLPLRALDPARPLAHRAGALPPRPAGLLLRRLARPLLPRRDHALDALRGGARDRGPPLLRRPPRGLPRRPRRDVPPLLARRRDRRPRGLARAAGGRRPLRPALPRPLRGGGAARPRRGRRQRADGPLQDPQRPHQGPLPAHGGRPGLEDRAHRLERVLAHRRRDRLRVALSRPPLHRLRRVDEHPRVGRERRQRRGHARVVPGAALQGRAGEAEDAHHRPRRRLGRAGGPGRRIREGDRGRDEPAHAPLRPPLRRAGREPLRPPAGGGDPLRGADVHPARRPLLRRHPHGLRGLVGGGRLGRALPLREPPLHGRGLPGVPRPPDARRRARHPALGRGRAAARVERGGPPRPGRGGPARGRPPREAAGRPRGPAADDLHAQEAALERRRDGTDGLVAGSASR